MKRPKRSHTYKKRNSILIKNDKQIEGIRKSCKVAKETLQFIQPYVVEGITTNELNNLMAKFIKDNGALSAPLNYRGYPKETCISLNDIICHGIPNDIKIKNGDILNIDVTTILEGYYGDTSSMFYVGEIPESTKKLIDVTKKCLELGIEQAKPKNHIGAIGFAIAQYAEALGFSVVTQFCGHGVGVGFHEPPQIVHKANMLDGPVILPNMTFTIEPMINEGSPNLYIEKDGWTARTIDGKLSAQFEHTILITEDGNEILT